MQDFRTLLVWRKSHALTIEVYKVCASLPRSEEFGLSSQMRRSSSSIGCNIAEGCGRGGTKEMLRFLRIASGSASELEYQLLLCFDLGWLDSDAHSSLEAQVLEVRKMLAGLARRLKQNLPAENTENPRLTN